MSSKLYWIIIVVALIFTRFYGFNWGDGYAFHPDENNMASAISQLTWTNFNPHFFAYGQFPLYLAFFSQQAIGIPNTFINSIYTLRFLSAIFACLSCLILYRLFPRKLFLFLLVFTPGLIQMAHFGTTESLLFLIFISVLYLTSKKQFYLAAIVCGVGVATKISALIFLFPAIISLIYSKKISKLLIFLVITLFISCLLSPYNLINYSDFISALKYETSVANGSLPVFYTHQFIGSIPYLFQLTHIFPYIAGLPMFLLSIFSLRYLKKYPLITLSSLLYFLYFGQVFVKWTRFMSPLFFIFPLLATFTISKIKFRPLYFGTIILTIIPGLIFFTQYFTLDIRVIASNWINQNIPENSIILSESGNVINLPLTGNYNVNNYDFYSQSPPETTAYDYIFIPSRRVFKNNFVPNYYQQLFSGTLGFSQIKQFTTMSNLFLSDENAEETWTVFDRPTIRIFQKNSEI